MTAGRRTIAGLFAAIALTSANALALTALYGSPAGAASAAVAQAREDDDHRTCQGHTGDRNYPSAGFGPAVKTVTVTEPGGTTQNYSTTGAVPVPDWGSSRGLPSPLPSAGTPGRSLETLWIGQGLVFEPGPLEPF